MAAHRLCCLCGDQMAQSHWHLHLHRDPQPLPAMSAPYDDDDIDGAPMEDDLDGAPLMPDLNAMPPLQGPSGALFQPQPLPSLMSDLASHHAAPAAPVAKVLTPFEKAALLKQEKQAREDAEAAAEYAKFVQTFEADGSATQQQAGSRRGGARGPGNSALLKTTKFVSGGVMGGEAAAPTMIAPPSTFPAIPPPVPAPASGTFAPAATSPAMRPMDPITLKASLPSLSAMSPGLKPVPFLPVTAKPLPFELAASAPSSGAVAAFSQATSIPSVPMKKATPFNAFLTAAEDESASSMPVSNKKKPRAIDAFIEELRQRAEDKAAGKLVDPIASGAPGERPRDTGDATSTNIFARSLAPDVVENDLVAAFCPFGQPSRTERLLTCFCAAVLT
jgi:hypothetical protein